MKILVSALCSVLCASALFAAAVNDVAPDFNLKDIKGVTHKLTSYHGKVIILNFWATWCPPCQAEMPSMQRTWSKWDAKKYVLLAVNIGEPEKKVKEFAVEHKYLFPILIDPDAKVTRRYFVRNIPATFIIDKNGRIINQFVGSREWSVEAVKQWARK